MGETVAKAPCKSCPYRRDVPSGIWDRSEYEKLPRFDGDVLDQLEQGGHALFDCHQQDGNLCAGWLAAHGAENLLACRLHAGKLDPKVWGYKSPVPVFGSGQEAHDHGVRDIDQPGNRARRMVDRLAKKQKRRDSDDTGPVSIVISK